MFSSTMEETFCAIRDHKMSIPTTVTINIQRLIREALSRYAEFFSCNLYKKGIDICEDLWYIYLKYKYIGCI